MADIRTDVNVRVTNLAEIEALISEAQVERREMRRERIATSALAALIDSGRVLGHPAEVAELCCLYADALIAALDKEPGA